MFSPFFVHDAHSEKFVGEVSQRRFPKALRPTQVFRDDGGHMSYEKWLATPHASPIVGMLFEDGGTVGRVGALR